jgi:hypothetical protein
MSLDILLNLRGSIPAGLLLLRRFFVQPLVGPPEMKRHCRKGDTQDHEKTGRHDSPRLGVIAFAADHAEVNRRGARQEDQTDEN